MNEPDDSRATWVDIWFGDEPAPNVPTVDDTERPLLFDHKGDEVDTRSPIGFRVPNAD